MRKLIPLLFLLTALVCSCKRNSDIGPNLPGQFRIAFSDGQVIDQNEIGFYDFSTSLIYLMPAVSFTFSQNSGTFDVFANNQKVYSGVLLTGYSSYFPVNTSLIITKASFFGDNVIHMDFSWLNGTTKLDPRKDSRIMDAMKKNDQYRAGMSCEIATLTKNTLGKITLQLQLKNNDSEDLYYLDPGKTGTELFHYFTNGLSLRDASGQNFNSNIQALQPSPWDGWKKEWLSLIKGNETKIVTLMYDHFDSIPAGNYTATFRYPALAFQVKKGDLYQNGTRIWLGRIDMSQTASFK